MSRRPDDFEGWLARVAVVAAIVWGALLLGAQAHSGERVEWAGMDGGPNFVMEIMPGAGGNHVATVTVTNQITHTFSTPGAAMLDLGDLRVRALVSHGAEYTPDTIRLALPNGLFSIPFELILEEGETGQFMIVNNLPMG